MRAAYVDAHEDLPGSFRLARAWVGDSQPLAIVGPDTRALEASPFLEHSGLPIGVVTNRHSRFTARPRTGYVIAWCLHVDEMLALQGRGEFDGLVVVRALKSHAPWITATEAVSLGSGAIEPVEEASPPIKAMVSGISMLPILNQGLTDSRERSTAVQALTFMYERGHRLDSRQLMVEAQRRGWPGDSPQHLADLAHQINSGKRLRFQARLNPEAMEQWDRA